VRAYDLVIYLANSPCRNGRWRSQWTIDASGNAKGVLRAQVHYYEDGNVQLQTEKKVEFQGNLSVRSLCPLRGRC